MKKICSRCKKSKDADNFGTDEKHLDGLKSSCNNCLKLGAHTPRRKLKKLLNRAKCRASTKNLDFDLDESWLAEKLKKQCEVTGLSFSFLPPEVGHSKNPYSPSIDRIDNKLGYTKDNCRLVIWAFNVAKQEWNEDVLYSWSVIFVNEYESGLTNGI